ncbi:RNA-guided endonuclease TnpB family protein [Actinomadura sp. BRA 177]|uniref:RNA-guided endonuclease InsQ/TnpB family protein n=1 Tax=Actinomadura sp. BRA 177 TaxID=2745202 RepID=UPI0015950D43|nr:RNA-guided endonuclease TnpB family protein [Actinomadura sp. BRA 177]NVI92391.1 transposase [Actinomadura sp. BRA 177]
MIHAERPFRQHKRPRPPAPQAFGCARVVYNDALAARRTAHASGLPYIKAAELSAAMTRAKKTPERCWLGEVSAVVLQQSLRDLETAYRAFFDGLAGKRPRVGAPRFKSRKDRRQSIRFTANARWAITKGGKLALPKIGELKVRWSRRLPSTPSTVTVIRDAAGRYFASFVVETRDDRLPRAGAQASARLGPDVEIDLGLEHFAVTSDGRKITSPRFLRRAAKKLRRAQQSLSRKQKGSANRDKARMKVARAHAKVADARREFHHQLSSELVRENQAVYAETLCVKGLARTRLAKSVHDAGWSAFLGMLEYKAQRYGRTFTQVGRAYPSSQICSGCGYRDGPKPLHVRAWTCERCGTAHDRDVNAARNILDEGRRIIT